MNRIAPTLLLALSATSSAYALVTIDTVYVGDVGNPADPTTGFGSVTYGYHIGTYEVTNEQYVVFLNNVAATDTHGLYNPQMSASEFGGIERMGASGSYSYSPKAGMNRKPVNFVSFWDAARFTNWLTTGDPETGVYNLEGVTSPTASSASRNATAWANGGVAVASDNEWYKAAYYDSSPSGPVDGYWLFATRSDNPPEFGAPPGSINSANYDSNLPGDVNDIEVYVDVGSYTFSSSYYGTFDQTGNVFEWTDTPVFEESIVMRGGSMRNDINDISSEDRWSNSPIGEDDFYGFRVTSLNPIVVPEFSICAAAAGLLSLGVTLLRRKTNR